MRVLAAATDLRYRRRLAATVVYRRAGLVPAPTTLELAIEDTHANVAVLQELVSMLDGRERLVEAELQTQGIELLSRATGERVVLWFLPVEDFARLEAVSRLEQIHIGPDDEDHGSWVCSLINGDRFEALFGGRSSDIRSA